MRTRFIGILSCLLGIAGCGRLTFESPIVENPDAIEAKTYFSTVSETNERTGQSVVFNPVAEQPFSMGSLFRTEREETYPAGDYSILVGVGPDDPITALDYATIYKIMNYLSGSGFRVLLNLRAESKHLREAVESDSTSAILWSSHGWKGGFSDYKNTAVPTDIFKNPGKNLYQMVVAPCYGRYSIDKNFEVPSHIRVWAWDGLVYHPTNVEEFLLSKRWSALDGKRVSDTVDGTYCRYGEYGEFDLVREKSHKVIWGARFTKIAACVDRIQTMNEGFTCRRDPDGQQYFRTSVLTAEKVFGGGFDSLDECLLRVKAARAGKICGFENDRYRYVESSTGKIAAESPEFETLENCNAGLELLVQPVPDPSPSP